MPAEQHFIKGQDSRITNRDSTIHDSLNQEPLLKQYESIFQFLESLFWPNELTVHKI